MTIQTSASPMLTPGARTERSEWEAVLPELGSVQVIMVTDIVAFTPLLVRLGDLHAQRLMQLHNRVLRECIRGHHGREVTHTGDGLLAAFRSVRCCIASALAIHTALAEHTPRFPEGALAVRVGMHIGEPMPEEGRLFGTCVNTAVRICGQAAGGSILASDLVRQVAAGQAIAFHDRGLFRLKGIETPLRLHEVLREAPSQRNSPGARQASASCGVHSE